MAEAVLKPPAMTAVVLAGGRGSRLGGVEKGELEIGGERLIDIVVGAALAAGCGRAIIAGPIHSDQAESVIEEPRYGGPSAGISAAVASVTDDWIMLLACDLPEAPRLCRQLVDQFRVEGPGKDGIVAIADDRVQWLSGLYRRSSLESALERLGNPAGSSLRVLLSGLDLKRFEDREGLTSDIDTRQDFEKAIERKETQ